MDSGKSYRVLFHCSTYILLIDNNRKMKMMKKKRNGTENRNQSDYCGTIICPLYYRIIIIIIMSCIIDLTFSSSFTLTIINQPIHSLFRSIVYIVCPWRQHLWWGIERLSMAFNLKKRKKKKFLFFFLFLILVSTYTTTATTKGWYKFNKNGWKWFVVVVVVVIIIRCLVLFEIQFLLIWPGPNSDGRPEKNTYTIWTINTVIYYVKKKQ